MLSVNTDSPLLPLTPLLSPFASPPSEPLNLPDVEDEPCAKHTCKLSQQILDIINGKASTAVLPHGVQLPNPVVKELAPRLIIFEGDGVAEQMLAVTNDRYEQEYDDHELTMFVEQASTAAEALEPTMLTDARRRPDWSRWEGGIHEELDMLEKAGTRELVDPPPNANIVESKWVFCMKKDSAGNIVRYKACLVTQGFSQVPGIDYFNTYAPIAKLASIWIVLAHAACQNLEQHQIDIKGAYLNGKLNENEVIYMHQLPSYTDLNYPHQVCHLHKTLYRLKQSGCYWYQQLVKILVTKLGFKQCEVDQAVFIKRERMSLMIIVVHVDDCTIATTTLALIMAFKRKISCFIEVTDLSELHWLLGIEVTRN